MDFNKKYQIIYTDPPWQFSNYQKPKHGAPQYPTMTFDDLCQIPIKMWAEDNCLLIMWCTWPMLSQGIKLIELWGFNYITGLPWIKTTPKSEQIRSGLGFWFLSTGEVLLFARLNNVSPPKNNKRLGLLVGENKQFYAPIRKHSEKPEDIRLWIENRFEGPYLELWARKIVPKWDCWGYDTGVALDKNGAHLI